MKPNWEQADWHNGLALCMLCPHCGGNYLRHGDVSVRQREKEDGVGSRIDVRKDASVAWTALEADSKTFVGRRDSIVIDLKCEMCPKLSELVVEQEKGQTFVSVRKAE